MPSSGGVAPCGSCKSRNFGGTYSIYHQGEKNQRAKKSVRTSWQLAEILRSVQRLLLAANIVPSSMIVFT
jgi:hypothetical protein